METIGLHERFLHCMAAFLNGTPVTLAVQDWPIEDWKAIFRLARRQSLSGALCVALGSVKMPEAAATRLQHDAVQLMTRYEDQRAIVSELSAALSAAAVDHLFFKGAVVREYYPHPAMRSMGDVDMLIRRESLDRAHGVMTACGFVCEEKSGEVWTYTRGGYLVEMHLEVRQYDVRHQTTVLYPDPWESAQKVNGTTHRWSDEQEAAHTVLHLAAHFCAGGCGLRQWMDVAVLCRRFPQAAFWDAVKARLVPLGMDGFLDVVLATCHAWFGTAEYGALPDKSVQNELLDRLLRDGTFGADERLVLADVRKELRRRQKSGRLGRLMRVAFPSLLQMKMRFPYVQRCPLWLPVAYVHRFVQGVTVNRRVHQKRLDYAREHRLSLEREVAFFEQIGL